MKTLAIGDGFLFYVFTPKRNDEEIKTGHQKVVVAGNISYNDGFPGTPNQELSFCFWTYYDSITKQNTIDPCDPNEWISKLKTNEGYPNNREP
jgi:hypothetical protein